MNVEDFDTAYSNPENDNEIPKMNDLRKTRLTLGAINRMRLVRDVRNLELKANLENIRRQYGKPAETQPGL